MNAGFRAKDRELYGDILHVDPRQQDLKYGLYISTQTMFIHIPVYMLRGTAREISSQ